MTIMQAVDAPNIKNLMRKLPLYPKLSPEIALPIHRTVVPPFAWRLITFILFIARALPGSRRRELKGRTELLLGPMSTRINPIQCDSSSIAAYAPSGVQSIEKEPSKGDGK